MKLVHNLKDKLVSIFVIFYVYCIVMLFYNRNGQMRPLANILWPLPD